MASTTPQDTPPAFLPRSLAACDIRGPNVAVPQIHRAGVIERFPPTPAVDPYRAHHPVITSGIVVHTDGFEIDTAIVFADQAFAHCPLAVVEGAAGRTAIGAVTAISAIYRLQIHGAY